MVFVFGSLILAMVTGLVAHAYYGTEALAGQVWVSQVFYSIIGAGAAMGALSWLRCAVCRRAESRDGSRPDAFSICGTRT
jgi:hypothetical protein